VANGWSDERKARQAEAIHRWKPWARSSGPKSDAGKAKVARNAWKHGQRSAAALAEMRRLRELLAEWNTP
jgi:hypothetical protein